MQDPSTPLTSPQGAKTGTPAQGGTWLSLTGHLHDLVSQFLLAYPQPTIHAALTAQLRRLDHLAALERASRAVGFSHVWDVGDLAVRCQGCGGQNTTSRPFLCGQTPSGERYYFCAPCEPWLLAVLQAAEAAYADA